MSADSSMLGVLRHPMGVVGLFGQALFFSRFLYQWIVSERTGASVVPTAFWFLSIGGGLLVLVYAIWRRDPVIILGQAVGVVVYARNLALIARTRRAKAVGG